MSPFSAAESRPWVIATDQHFPPYVYQDAGGIKGIHVDIVAAVMQRMDADYKLSAYPWARVVLLTDKNEVDFSFPFVAKPERFEKYLMVGPIHHGRTVLAVRSEDIYFKFKSLQDLNGMVVGTVRGYAYEKAFDDADFFHKDISSTDNVSLVKKLVFKRLDIIIGDENVLTEEAKKLGVNGKLRFLPKIITEAVRYVAFPKNRPERARAFQQALDAIIADGTYQKILERYK